MKIIKKSRNDLLKRDEITALLIEQSNPGFDKALSLLASELKVAEELIILKSLRSKFGSNEFTLDAFTYDTTEDRQKFEPKLKAEVKKEAQ